MTKKQQAIINNYNKSMAYCLDDVYATYSVFKARAEKQILNEMESVGGWGYKITGANSNTFSCAYLMTDADGVVKIVYHTAQNKRVFDYIA
jgi:hypothetical protein